MSCLNIQEIYAYLEGELLPARLAEVENHLVACPKCQQAVIERRLIEEAFSKLPDIELPADFSRQVMARILRSESFWPTRLAAVFIALSAVGLVSFLLILTGGKTAFTLIGGFNRLVLVYFKNATVVLAKLMILLLSIGKFLGTMVSALDKGLSLLASLASTEGQVLLLSLTGVILVSLYIGLKNRLLPGEKT